MKCKRCHKELKNPKSVQNGYGPVCWSKMLAAHPVAVGKTSTEKSFVPIFEQLYKEKTKKNLTKIHRPHTGTVIL